MRSTNVNMTDPLEAHGTIIISLDGFWSSDRVEESETYFRVSLLSFGSGGATALQDKETGKCTGWTKKHNCKRCPEVFRSFSQLSHENAAVVAIVCAKGIGFVNFIDPESAQKAIRALNSFPFLDRELATGRKTLRDVCCV